MPDTARRTDADKPVNTVKLYDTEPYGRSFRASVLSSGGPETDAQGRSVITVELDRTLFFPEEGGQSPDGGSLYPEMDDLCPERKDVCPGRKDGGFEVTDVQIRGGRIFHTVVCGDLSAFAEGTAVRGEIDWEHRFSNMQNHTGEHILSGLMHRRYGFDNIGFRLSENTVSLDVNGQLDEKQIRELETEANETVYRNASVKAEYPPAEILSQLDYRSKSEIDGPVRIVTIEGTDCCACCAPHVARTGEIGLIRILRVQRFKGGMRLFILCGRRALELTQRQQRSIEEISHLTNRPQEEISDAAASLLSQNGILRRRIRELEYQKALLQLSLVPEDAENVFLFAEEMDALAQRELVNRIAAEHAGCCGVFCGNGETGYHFIIGTVNGDSRIPCAKLREHLGAKGGGKPEMVQGFVSAGEERIREVLEH